MQFASRVITTWVSSKFAKVFLVLLWSYDSVSIFEEDILTLGRLPSCISTWLSPERESKNSCPSELSFPSDFYLIHAIFISIFILILILERETDSTSERLLKRVSQLTFDPKRGMLIPKSLVCRHRFFEAVGEAVGEEEEESWTEVYFRDIVRRVGQPPRVGLAAENATWYDYYVEAAAEQYQESLTRARAFRSTRNPGFDHLPSEQIEHSVACQATAFRTLPVRETLLYIEFGFDEVVPRLEGPIRGPLNAEQSGTYISEMVLPV